MKRKILSLFLTAALTAAAVTGSAAVSSAWSLGGGPDYDGRDCTGNTIAAAAVDYVKSKYRGGSTYTGAGECWGYAETVSSIFASERSGRSYKGLKFTKKNFLEKCEGAMAGTHLRLSHNKTFNGSSGHSIVLFKVSEDEMFWADCNYDEANTICYYSGTLDDFFWNYGQYEYLNRVIKPTKYKLPSASKVSSRSLAEEGGIKLSWLQTSATSRYEVYRSYTGKSGSFKRIAKRTKTKNYLDKSVPLGKKAYYKIKSVKKNGSAKYSSTVVNTLRLPAPELSMTNDAGTGNILLSWNKVEKADRYKIYRSADYGKEKLIKTTEDCAFTDTGAEPETFYTYRVKAVYDRNTNGNSAYSNQVEGYVRGAPTELSGKLNAMGEAVLTWKGVKGADLYEIYISDAPDGEYWYLGESETERYVDTKRSYGQPRYYKVVAYDYDYFAYSDYSGFVKV